MSLVVIKAMGLVTVQDLGRPGRMHEALPPGGALVPSMLVRSNRAVGNSDGAAGIEVCGRLVVRAESDVRVAIGTPQESEVILEGESIPSPRVIDVRAGDELVVASDTARATYLAVRGGVDAPIVLGGRGAHLSAGIGSLIRAGDRIAIGPKTGDGPRFRRGPDTGDAPMRGVRVVLGPDRDAFSPDALDVLVGSEWRISSSSNRVGTRLEGPRLARRADHVEQSRPMVIGAIELPRDGAPIVLGPEHPTTGGYPIVAVVASEDLDAFHSIPLGGAVRFRLS